MSDRQLSQAERIDVVMDLVRDLSSATDPSDVLRIFARGITKLTAPRAYMALSVRNLPPGQYKITRYYEEMESNLYTGVDPWTQWDQIPAMSGGFLGSLIAGQRPQVIHDLNIPNDPQIGNRLAKYRSLMAVPLFDNGKALNWALFFRREPNAFTDAELEDAILRGNLVGGTVRTTIMARELKLAHDRIQHEVEQIARIQRGLLPQSLPHIPGLIMAADYQTYDRAGGDLYDIVPITSEPLRYHDADPHGPWAMIIADASGHGPAATTVSAMLHAVLHAYPRKPEGPGEILEHANRHLCAKRIESSFVTAFMAIYDPADRTLTYARAGHPPALVKSPGVNGPVRRLDEVGEFPLGVIDDATYEQATVQLEQHQTVLLYTDGIIEAQNRQQAMFGVEGVERALTACNGEPACVVRSVTTALRDHEGGKRPSDDQTILAVQVK